MADEKEKVVNKDQETIIPVPGEAKDELTDQDLGKAQGAGTVIGNQIWKQ